MLFVKLDGTIIEINRIDYKNDYLYYKKIYSLKIKNVNCKNKLPKCN
jgi:hypothetical protein